MTVYWRLLDDSPPSENRCFLEVDTTSQQIYRLKHVFWETALCTYKEK